MSQRDGQGIGICMCFVYLFVKKQQSFFFKFLYITLHSQNQCMRDSISPFLPEFGIATVFCLSVEIGMYDVSLWFCFTFPKCIVMSSIFSCAYLPSSSIKCLFVSFVHFLTWIFCLFNFDF